MHQQSYPVSMHTDPELTPHRHLTLICIILFTNTSREFLAIAQLIKEAKLVR